jgi:hypothetical protein
MEGDTSVFKRIPRRVWFATSTMVACCAVSLAAQAREPVVTAARGTVNLGRVIAPPRLLEAEAIGETSDYRGGHVRHVIQVEPTQPDQLAQPGQPALTPPSVPQERLPGDVTPPLPPLPNQFVPSEEETQNLGPDYPSLEGPISEDEPTQGTAPSVGDTLTIWNFQNPIYVRQPCAPKPPHYVPSLPRSWPTCPCESYAKPCFGPPPKPVGLVPFTGYCPYCKPPHAGCAHCQHRHH